MNELYDDPELRKFRTDVAKFLEREWPCSSGDAAFRAAAIGCGYLYRNIPRAFGGSEQQADPTKAHIIREEFKRVGAPSEIGGGGVNMVVPTLLAYGENWQKELFIPKTLNGEYVWAQGYSEPEAGSDLANVRTAARLEGDQWVINGQKTWTTGAETANMMFALVRTEPSAPKHEGISYMLIDLCQPGVTIRPIKQIDGRSRFSEVFLEDVCTPKDWIVGERGKGWEVSRATITFERSHISGASVTATIFSKLLALAKRQLLDGRLAIDHAEVRDELGCLQGMVAAHSASATQQLYDAVRGVDSKPAIGPINKLYNSMIMERIALCAQKIVGSHALAQPVANQRGPGRWVEQYFNSIASQIGGGTSNMQRNAIGERALGLPRDESNNPGVE